MVGGGEEAASCEARTLSVRLDAPARPALRESFITANFAAILTTPPTRTVRAYSVRVSSARWDNPDCASVLPPGVCYGLLTVVYRDIVKRRTCRSLPLAWPLLSPLMLR